MGNLNKRFSELTSLVILLVLSIATTYLFFFASKIQAVAQSWDDYEMNAAQAAGIDLNGDIHRPTIKQTPTSSTKSVQTPPKSFKSI